MALALLAIQPGQASAAVPADPQVGISSFTSTISFNAELTSRRWEQAAGSTDIKPTVTCTDNVNGTYYLRLYRDFSTWPDSQQGSTRTVRCSSTRQTITFSGLRRGKYYFVMTTRGDAEYLGKVQVVHPSAYPCDGYNPNTFDPTRMRTAASIVGNGNRLIELRYSSGGNCFWGRISRGGSGDSVWIDRAPRLGDPNYKGLMYQEYTRSGFTQAHTLTVDSGGTAVVRACGFDSRSGVTFCTSWHG